MQGTSLKKKSASFSLRQITFYGLIVVFIIGMFYGTFLAKTSSGIVDFIKLMTREYQYLQISKSLLQTFVGSFASCFMFILMPYLLGFSAIGQPAVFLIPLFKGLGIGLTMGHLYGTYGIKGVGYSALIIIPQTVLCLFALIIACRESIKLSCMFFKCTIRVNSGENVSGKLFSPETIRLYNVKFIVLTIIALAAALIDTICVLLFYNIFKFV